MPIIGTAVYLYFIAKIPDWSFDIINFAAVLWQNNAREPLLQLNFILSIFLLIFSFFFFTLFVPEKKAPLWLHGLPLKNSRLTLGNTLVSFGFFLLLTLPPIFIIAGILNISASSGGSFVYSRGLLGTASFIPWIIAGLYLSRILRFGIPKTNRGKIIFISFMALAAAYFLIGILNFQNFLHLSPSAIFPILVFAPSFDIFLLALALWFAWIMFGAVLFSSAASVGRFHSPYSKKPSIFKNFLKNSDDDFYTLAFKRLLRHKEILLTLILSIFVMSASIFMVNKAAIQGISAGNDIFTMIVILGISSAILIPTIDNSLGWLWASSPQGRKKQFKSYLLASLGLFIFFSFLMTWPMIFNLVSGLSFLHSIILFIFCLSIGIMIAIFGNVKLSGSFSMLALSIIYALIIGGAVWSFSFIGGKFGQTASDIIAVLLAIILFYLAWKKLEKKQWEDSYDF